MTYEEMLKADADRFALAMNKVAQFLTDRLGKDWREGIALVDEAILAGRMYQQREDMKPGAK